MKKKGKFLIFCMIFVIANCIAQQNKLQCNTAKGFINSSFYAAPSFTIPALNKAVISPGFYVNNLGFFCKQELNFQSSTRIPFKFRLGSVQYCDWMEGKKNAGILPAY